MSEVFNVHQQWFDPVIGGAMINGKVYYGLPNTDPKILSNQIDVFADRALTVDLPNPQTIGIGGRVENKPWVGQRYSIRVDDRFGVMRYSYPDQGENPSSGETLVLSNVQGINNITCETPAGITQYVAQQLFTLRTVATNTGDMTINIDGVGAKPIKFNFNEQIAPGFFQAQQVILLIYNSVGDNFSWANAGRGISLLTGVAGDGDTITANGGPSTIAYVDGQQYQFKPNADNTVAVTLDINGLGPIAVESNGSALSPGRLATDIAFIVSYNSIRNTFELVNSNNLSSPDPIGDVTPNTIKATTFEGASGTTINKFSGDGNLSENSNDNVPTELAVKTYIDTNIATASGRVLQVVQNDLGVTSSTTALIPSTSIPQNTEGAEFFNVAITPKFSTSTLFIDVHVSGFQTGTTGWVAALFKDSTANSIAGIHNAVASGGQTNQLSFSLKIASGSTSLQTFKVRCGAITSGTFRINSTEASTQALGSIPQSSIRIMEVAP